MLLRDFLELIKKYEECPECGNDKVGGEPSQGSLIVENDVLTRSCKCSWSVVIDSRMMTEKRGGKLIGGYYEVHIQGVERKLLPLIELKEKAGASCLNQHVEINNWLNSEEGQKWALEIEEESV